MEAWGEAEFSLFVDSLPDVYAALNAEAFLYWEMCFRLGLMLHLDDFFKNLFSGILHPDVS